MNLPNSYIDKLNNVINLYKSNNIIFEKVIAKYPDTDFYKKILSLSGKWGQQDEFKLHKILSGTSHHRDFRNPREYAFNIILNWLIEDLVFWILFRSGANIKKSGSDKERQLLSGNAVSADSDLLVINNRKKIFIEIIANYPTRRGFSSFWEQNGSFDLRDFKLNNLLRESESGTVFIVGIVVAKSKFFIMEINRSTNVNKINSQRNIGYKQTNEIIFENKKVDLYSLDQIIDKIV